MDERVAMFRLRDGADQASAPRPAEKSAPAASAPKLAASSEHHSAASKPNSAARKPVAAATKAVAGRRGGPVGRMQTQLATAINQDADWKEF